MKKVFVGLSGGVDSAVSAALLKRAGYDVIGVFIKVWQPDWLECNWREDRRDAMRVAAHIGIPFITLDLEKEYKKGVIDYMLVEYSSGRTPNPDVMCNREVKFGAFWKWAKEHGADFIATGHYARVSTIKGSNKNESGLALFAGIDSNKDQSYFLWTLNQGDLRHVLFPVGHLVKPEVRKLAKRFKLPNAIKKDSQGLCFIGKVDLKGFLAHYIKTKEGKLLNEKGMVIGNHPGALFFTLGERHGFTITTKSPNDEAYYVIAKDMKDNTVTVSNKRNDLSTNSVTGLKINISNTNWCKDTPRVGQMVSVRTRYRQPLIKAKIISVNDNNATFEIKNTTDPITPGQSLVAYDRGECLGGGVIC